MKTNKQRNINKIKEQTKPNKNKNADTNNSVLVIRGERVNRRVKCTKDMKCLGMVRMENKFLLVSERKKKKGGGREEGKKEGRERGREGGREERRKGEITSVGKDVEKKESTYTIGGNVNWCSHY